MKKDRCTFCGNIFGGYDNRYTDGSVMVCFTCLEFGPYFETHRVITESVQCSKNPREIKFYEWKDLETFLRDHYEPGVEWKWRGFYMMDYLMANGEARWIATDDDIMNEIENGLKHWEEVTT